MDDDTMNDESWDDPNMNDNSEDGAFPAGVIVGIFIGVLLCLAIVGTYAIVTGSI